MEKVTQNFNTGKSDALDQLSRVVRSVYGSPHPDLEQEAFLRTFQAFRKQSQVRHPRALMWKVVRDTVADYWRQELRHRGESIEEIPERFAARACTMDLDLDRAQKIELLRHAILCLGCDVRGAVYLYYLEGYSIKTIARIYKKSQSAIKMALLRGRRDVGQMIHASATNNRDSRDFHA